MGRSSQHHHRTIVRTPQDRAFLATFVGMFAGLMLGLAALVWITDPAAVFGTGVVPPIVSADRDYKAALYGARNPRPEIVLLGSSRVETLRPDCVLALTGRPAFNFGVNAAMAEDFLAIFRFMRSQPGFSVRQILLGIEPEAFTEDQGIRRAHGRSRVLAPFFSQPVPDGDLLWSDLWSAASVRLALRSMWHFGFNREDLPQEAVRPDGFQVYPLWDEEIHHGRFQQQLRVSSSSRAIRSRYLAQARISPTGLAQLDLLFREAGSAGVRVTTFVPPVHPALLRDAATTPLPALTNELVSFLRASERSGLVRYVETRSLDDFGGDSTLYYDAIHMRSGNADQLLARLYRSQVRCAVQ
ncbi:MAG: hypothetical protein ACREMZ_06820 [Gemmatimonadales bacterium]